MVTIQDFVPLEQEEKLLLIEEMALTTGPIAMSTRPEPPPKGDAARQRHALETLASALDRFIKAQPSHPATETARKLKSSLANLFTRLDTASADERGKLLNSVEDDLLVTLPIALQSLRLATEAAPFNEDDLPDRVDQPVASPHHRRISGSHLSSGRP